MFQDLPEKGSKSIKKIPIRQLPAGAALSWIIDRKIKIKLTRK